MSNRREPENTRRPTHREWSWKGGSPNQAWEKLWDSWNHFTGSYLREATRQAPVCSCDLMNVSSKELCDFSVEITRREAGGWYCHLWMRTLELAKLQKNGRCVTDDECRLWTYGDGGRWDGSRIQGPLYAYSLLKVYVIFVREISILFLNYNALFNHSVIHLKTFQLLQYNTRYSCLLHSILVVHFTLQIILSAGFSLLQFCTEKSKFTWWDFEQWLVEEWSINNSLIKIVFPRTRLPGFNYGSTIKDLPF